MNFSCTSSLLVAAGARDFRDAVGLAASLGFNGLCIECGAGGLVPAQSFSFRTSGEMVVHAQQRGMELHCLIGDAWLPADPDDHAFGLKRLVCMAHALACPLVAVTTPAIDETVAFDPQYERMVAAFRDALELAVELDICLALEPRAASLAVNADEAMDLVDDVDRKNLGIVYNPQHLAAHGGEEPGRAVEMLKEYLLLVRLEPADGRGIAEGACDEPLQLLHAAGYGHYVADCSSSGPGMPPAQVQQHLRAHLAHLRSLEPVASHAV